MKERARGDTKSRAIGVDPAKPAVFIRIAERKDASDTQSDGVEVCFGPGGVCILASIHSGPGQVLGPRNS
jgi:hypothetical protein